MGESFRVMETFCNFYSSSVDLGGREILSGGDVLGGGDFLDGGDVLGAEDVLSGGDIFYFLCFIRSFGWQSHFGWRRLFG